MRIRRAFLLTAAFLFAASLNCYLFVHELLSRTDPTPKLSAGDCPDPAEEVPAQTNPNKALFVSCGGFID